MSKELELRGVKRIKYHQSSHQNRTEYACSECKRSFLLRANLRKHLRKHMGLKPHPCTECEKTFNLKKELLEHLRTHLVQEPFQCTECEKRFHRRGHLTVHWRMHSGERPFQCTECDRSFIQKVHLNRHLRVHSGERPYRCSKCGKTYTRKEYLIRHQRLHAEKSTKTKRKSLRGRQFRYPTFGHSFTKNNYFISHQRKHKQKSALTMRGRLYQCDKHKNGIHVQSNFSDLLKAPNQDREDRCTYCKKTMRQINNHMRNHRFWKGVQPHQCTECEKSFAQNIHHLIEEKKHTGEKTRKTHMIIARLLEVSVPNEYFTLHNRNASNFQISNAFGDKWYTKKSYTREKERLSLSLSLPPAPHSALNRWGSVGILRWTKTGRTICDPKHEGNYFFYIYN